MKSQEANGNSPIPPQHMREKHWVRRVREGGDRDAFEKIFRAYFKRLHGYAYSFVKQPEKAEDIVQIVFLRIWANHENWDPPGKVKNYLFKAVRNEALNTLRHDEVAVDAHKELTYDNNESKYVPDFDSENEIVELRIKIQKCIDKLPPRCRQIYLLNRRSGLTYSEIADYLDLSINTVNTQMGRALKSLRDYLSDYLRLIITSGMSAMFF